MPAHEAPEESAPAPPEKTAAFLEVVGFRLLGRRAHAVQCNSGIYPGLFGPSP